MASAARIRTLAVGVAAACALAVAPGAAWAGLGNLSNSITSQEDYNNCIAGGHNRYICASFSLIADPVVDGVTAFTLTYRYDASKYVFDPTNSGPLGVFSVGGDAPPLNPGVGTEPLRLMPATGYTPGAPLPGSTLTYTDVGGLLTVDYQLGSAVSEPGNVNFFRLDFKLLKPIVIDLANSTVTYHTSGPGKDVSFVSFACSRSGVPGACGSDVPSTGSTFNYDYVPEPGAWLLMTAGFGGLGAALRRRRGGGKALGSSVSL